MKILVVGSYATSLINFRGPLLAAMIDAGHEVLACAPGEDQEISRTLAQLDVTYQSIRLSRGGINPFQDIKTLLDLYRIFRRFSPDITLSYTIKPVIYSSLVARFIGFRQAFSIITGLGFAFVELQNDSPERLKRRLLNRLIKLLYRLALSGNAGVFFQNPDDRKLFIESGLVEAEKAVLINGSGVDLDHFAVAPLPAHDYPTFLLIARLLKHKGIVEYASAAAILKKKYPGTAFHLLGWFDEENPASITKSQLEQWQHDGYIEYLGATNDVRPFLADTSVYVLPTFYREGVPRTILEAMAIGRPIITTDAPGCRETVIEGENGFLVPVQDASALADAMEKFIGHPELIMGMGKRSREIAVEKYDVHKVNAVIMETMGLNK